MMLSMNESVMVRFLLLPGRESVMKDSRIKPAYIIEKRNKREKRKNKNNNKSISDEVPRAKSAAFAVQFTVRWVCLPTMDLTAIERTCELLLRLSS
ncbi:hypothetical protein [Bacillus sp. AG4(2022)]|uniref:hypothetical protein n=1 Tax=Bacillus sp. AG4(2022) TaxID=2962594 RepID=UPI0028815F9E|nr:hypothetical protein [Bacillus sp. AG4(2022)]MDT0161626.1 hypothetical protein [Bacillus sp. AG4(2022)]